MCNGPPARDVLLLQWNHGCRGHHTRAPNSTFVGRCEDHFGVSPMQHEKGYIVSLCTFSEIHSRKHWFVPRSCGAQQDGASPAPLFDVASRVWVAWGEPGAGRLAPTVVQGNVGKDADVWGEATDTRTHNGKKWHAGGRGSGVSSVEASRSQKKDSWKIPQHHPRAARWKFCWLKFL